MKKAFVATTGNCYPHRADSCLIEGYLRRNRWSLARKMSSADVIIVNTCAFTRDKEDIAIKTIKKALGEKRNGAEIIVTGCLPAINKLRLERIFQGTVIHPNSLNELDRLLKAEFRLRETAYIGATPTFRQAKLSEYSLRIGWGCSGQCSYCAVRFVFGSPRSRPMEEICREFDQAYDKGFRRFMLIATDAGSFGCDSNSSLVKLVTSLCRKHNDCQFAISHLTPNKLKEILPDLEALVSCGKIFYMNIPVESGSARIIRLMNRFYSIGDFRYSIQKLITYNPQLWLKTDIIVGFPTESEEDFLDTLRLVEWLARNKVAFQCLAYSKRPNTKACQMPGQINTQTKQERLRRLKRLCYFSAALKDKKLFSQLKREKL